MIPKGGARRDRHCEALFRRFRAGRPSRGDAGAAAWRHGLPVAAFLLAFTLAASAADLTLLSGFVSHHDKSGYRESNPGLGVRVDSGRWTGWLAGTYRNSLDRQSVYVGREWLWPLAGPLSIGGILVGATGYRSPVVPVPLGEVVARWRRLELALLLQPVRINDSPSFVALQLRFRLW